MSQPTEMRAFVVEELKKGVVQTSRAVPKVASDEILVKVSHVALNPTDWKHLDYISNKDSILGCDYSGTVQATGDGAKKFQVGDKVCGVVHGGKFPDRGSFAEYLIVKEENSMAAPKSLGDAEAATYGVGFCTAAMAVLHSQKYSLSGEQKKGWFLVSGGSTSVGLYTVALLRHIGVKCIATASPHSFDLVKSYGADHVVDYHNKDEAIKEIQSITEGGVVGGLECVGGDANYELSVKSFGKAGGKLTTILAPPQSGDYLRKDIEIAQILLYTAFGVAFEFLPGQPDLPASPEDKAWYVDFVKHAQGDSGLISEIKANPVDVKTGGLDKIHEGLDLLRQNKVSGKKIVYKISA